MTHFIATHHDLLLLLYTALVATIGYRTHKTIAEDDSEIVTNQLKADVTRLLSENELQREIIRQLGLSQARTLGKHPAGKGRHLHSIRDVDTR